MTKHDLKELAAMGAELGAAKAENEKLRKALKRIIDRCEAFVDDEAEMRTPSVEVLMGIAEDAIYTVHEADVALSHQAEPTDTYTAVDMATAAAQGFRDGQAAVEQAAAQDERESVERFSPTTSVPHCGRASEVEAHMTEDDDGEYMTVAQHERIVAALTRPAQTEQQLAGWRRVAERLIANVEILDKRPRPMCRDCADCNGICDSGLDCDIRGLVEEARAMLAAPIPQTSPQPERDREADRARFPDPVFNTWLDEGISDAGHTVWDQVNVCDAWAGWENRQWYTAPQHTDDEAVDRFAAAMKAKLAASRAKGRGGWDDASVCTVEFLAQLLVEHLGKGNAGTFEDVANFAMMLHQRGADPRVLALAVTPQPEQNRLDTQRLEFMVSQRALVNSQNGTASPTVYRVCWPSESRQQADWYPSERDAIDAAMAAKEA